MKYAERIDVRLSQNGCVSAKFFGEEIITYRVPYSVLKSKTVDMPIDNPFIVYILVGKESDGSDSAYVGKSIRGIDNRPASHEDKGCNWSQCYIITVKGDSFLNDGIIQYMEYCVCNLVNDTDGLNNTTNVTNTGTANEMDRYSADKLLDRAYRLLNVLGLNLITNRTNDYSNSLPETSEVRQKTINDLDLSSDQLEQMNFIHDSLLKLDPHLRVAINDSSWNYIRFSFANKNKALVYCRGIRNKGIIRSYIQGTSDLFNDPEVLPVSPGEVYGGCKSVFDVRNHSDAIKLVNLCTIAYRHF